MQLGIGLLLASAVALAAFAARRLSSSGAIAAAVLGAIVYGAGGWHAAMVLLTFFVSSSMIERHLEPFGRRPAGRYAKGGRRDAGQVLGNGMTAVVFVVMLVLAPGAIWPWLGFAGSVAAVTADTWATELGALSGAAPRLITHPHRRVPPGTSGGISFEGTLAAALGSCLIATVASLLGPSRGAELFVPIAVAGLAGALVDSILGATVQGMYVCAAEQVETEQHPVHHCGSPTVHSRGWAWLTNDLVNLSCGAAGSVAACALGFATGGF
jgi:uncharacterized protein (TIGR00297 family)